MLRLDSRRQTAVLVKAMAFAAAKHRDQRRKDANASPYINHPVEVANVLANEAGVHDVDTLCAALLHDTLEDTETTRAELVENFGETVTRIVEEVTDDRTLTRTERKRRQLERAAGLSKAARCVKLADKICNVRDLAARPPMTWDDTKKQEYLGWASQIVELLRHRHSALGALFDAAALRLVEASSAPPIHVVSMRGPWQGTSAWARAFADGRIELELYDHSPEAESSLGNDVAWVYTVAPADKPTLRHALARHLGRSVETDAEILSGLATFGHLHAARDWLRASGISLNESFVSWA